MSSPIPPTGEWTGFYFEYHRSDRSWMHIYLEFDENEIQGEGTDYVGPWHAIGHFQPESGACSWIKQYVGKHQVEYQGTYRDGVIAGVWQIGAVEGPFSIWPKSHAHLTELYLKKDLERTHGGSGENRYSFDIQQFLKNPL